MKTAIKYKIPVIEDACEAGFGDVTRQEVPAFLRIRNLDPTLETRERHRARDRGAGRPPRDST